MEEKRKRGRPKIGDPGKRKKGISVTRYFEAIVLKEQEKELREKMIEAIKKVKIKKL